MRKFILIAALMVISAGAHAGPSIDVASNDTPAPAAQTADVKTEPARQDAAKPVKVARKHEGGEAKARRIAAKYGVYF